MKRILWRLGLSFVATACLTAGAVLLHLRANADAKPPAQGVSTPPPANSLPVTAGIPDVMPYLTKSVIEMPTERLLVAGALPASPPPAPAFVNPKVEPGKVRWHKAFADACAAAKKSGKPVLLFQMMGKLDERFC